ncbi:hypothetical protein [Yoonia maritima]|uniref:hypothetical protein n=1 Tax=Yoonia maritima TaxID=1435347 RepID=UPI000D0FF615|nr:hypothetical protein [Yoonia maritima]
MIEARKGFDLSVALNAISSARTINGDGSISLPSITAMDKWESYLASALIARGKSDAFIRSVVGRAIKAKQDLSIGEFLKDCRRVAHELEKDRTKNYKVLFPMWGNSNLLSGRRKQCEVWLNFGFSTNSTFIKKAVKERVNQVDGRDFSADLPGYSFPILPLAIGTVKAIDPEDAYMQADDAISLELGVLSVLCGRGQSIIPTTPNTPIATTLVAPQITVHEMDGALSTDTFWYDKWSLRSKSKELDAERTKVVLEYAHKIRSSLPNLPWRQEAGEALRRHYRAFRHTDPEAAFLDAWRLLELIAGPNYTKNDLLVERAASFFRDRKEMRELGRHLMHRRNSISHGKPIRADDSESLVFQVRSLIQPMLMNFLTNPFEFSQLTEFWSFADLDESTEKRERQKYLLECAARFRKEC